MAVYVDISKTRHLTYSPLNQKHNILYNRARENVNQRHIQKPWFDLNPFLNTEDHKGASLDLYRPTNDRRILPMESLVIVEDFFSDKPHFAKEFKIREFWDYLFSVDWHQGYSVRVLDGRLQGLLLSVLVSFTQAGIVSQHSTIAYAKNRRKRFSFYKHSQKEPELRPTEETLLLEFIYYGHAVHLHTPQLQETSSAIYPEVTTCSTTTYASSEIESSDRDLSAAPSHTMFIASTGSPSVRPPPTGASDPRRQRLLRRKFRKTRNSLSHITDEGNTVPILTASIPQGEGPSKIDSTHSTASEDYRLLPPPIDLSRFKCTERITYLGEFDLSDDSSDSGMEDEQGLDFGQELYLGDRETSTSPKPEEFETTERRLRQRKEVRAHERQLRREQLQQTITKARETFMPEFSELDINKYVRESEMKLHEKEKSPDLEDYIKYLKKSDRENVRYKNNKPKHVKEFAKRLGWVTSGNQRFADEVGGVTSSQACRFHCLNTMDSTFRMMNEPAKKRFLLQKLARTGGREHEKQAIKNELVEPSVKKIEVPLIYISTATGITFLHPVSRMMMQTRRRKQQQAETEKLKYSPKAPIRRRKSLIPVPTKSRNECGRRQSIALRQADLQNKDGKWRFPKAKLVMDDETSSEESESESDGLSDSTFNTKKLNIKYSLENIKNAKMVQKREKPKRKAADIFNVLRKYYRMQGVLKALGRGRQNSSSGGRMSSAFGGAQLRRQKKKKPVAKGGKASEEEEKSEVGKLKWFSFLEKKKGQARRPEAPIVEPLFEVLFSMDEFRANVERALQEFVVRKEMVISDYNAKASVSITFTKKSVFSKTKAYID